MNTYSIDRLQPLTIGRVGDHRVTQIPIDCSVWIEKYPELTTFYIEAVAPDGATYIPSTAMDGNMLIWNVTETDTTQPGYGEYQVIAEGEDGMKKTSASPPFVVLGEKRSASPGDSGDNNTGNDSGCNCDTETLREEFSALVADATSAANRAEGAADRAEETAGSVEDTTAIAEDAAARAQTSASQAEQSVELMRDTAERAEIAATSAEGSSAKAEAAVQQANEAKEAAEVSAESARESAELAQGATGGFGDILVIHGGKAVFPNE